MAFTHPTVLYDLDENNTEANTKFTDPQGSWNTSSFNFSSNFLHCPTQTESKLKNTSETKNGTIEHSIKKNSQQYTQGR